MLVGLRGSTWRAVAYFAVSFFTSVLWWCVIVTMLVAGALTPLNRIGNTIQVAKLAVARG
jgi:hypothetical protein